MKKNLLPFFLLFSMTTTFQAFSQIKQDGKLFLSLKQLQSNEWGVYVTVEESIEPTQNTKVGAGQITIVAPAGFSYYDFRNHGGTWVENARVTNPVEAQNMAYISFGFVSDLPKIQLTVGTEELLFSFKADDVYFGKLSLFENGKDPFEAPNSWGTNPGNDLGMIDRKASREFLYYTYEANIMDQNYEMPRPVLVSKRNSEE